MLSPVRIFRLQMGNIDACTVQFHCHMHGSTEICNENFLLEAYANGIYESTVRDFGHMPPVYINSSWKMCKD